MSSVLARIRVTEKHGIRRFLYPLTAEVTLPITLDYAGLGIATRDNDIDMERLCLVTNAGETVPVQVTHVAGERFRVDFAVSLAPSASQEYHLLPGTPEIVNDPLQITKSNNNHALHNHQQHFGISLFDGSPIEDVTYGGVRFLRAGLEVTRNVGQVDEQRRRVVIASHSSTTLTAWAEKSTRYVDGRIDWTRTEITACKSWATVTYTAGGIASGEEVALTLPLTVTSPTLTCDFGVGGYVFGKLQAGTADEVIWRTQFTKEGTARWTVATAGRVDYVGEATKADFLSQRWFHLIDSDKALAVAITEIPPECAEMTVTLRVKGDVLIAFRLGEVGENTKAKFGVCYHFLNDVPAIAAATNPQSILLPPTVEVLAV